MEGRGSLENETQGQDQGLEHQDPRIPKVEGSSSLENESQGRDQGLVHPELRTKEVEKTHTMQYTPKIIGIDSLQGDPEVRRRNIRSARAQVLARTQVQVRAP